MIKKNSTIQIAEKDTHAHADDMGFTLLELTVVIALISIIFFVTLPRIQNDIFINQNKKMSRWLLTSVRYLKGASARDHADYALHVDIENGKFWTSHVSMSDEKLTQSKTAGLTLSDGNRVIDVEFAGDRKITTGMVMVQFFAKGYSEHAIIHVMDEDDNEWSYRIPPFLPRLKISEGYVDLDGS